MNNEQNPYAPSEPQAAPGATQTAPGATQAAPGATQTAPGATQAAPEATQAAPEATQAATSGSFLRTLSAFLDGPGPQHPNGSPQNSLPPKPDNYLVWAILATICCCVPLGVPAIVFSCQVNSAYEMGNYDLALKKAKDAKKWSIIAAAAGIVGGIICGILQVCAGILSSL